MKNIGIKNYQVLDGNVYIPLKKEMEFPARKLIELETAQDIASEYQSLNPTIPEYKNIWFHWGWKSPDNSRTAGDPGYSYRRR